MKLGDFTFDDGVDSAAALLETLRGFNATARAYPRDRTVHALFAALVDGDHQKDRGRCQRRPLDEVRDYFGLL